MCAHVPTIIPLLNYNDNRMMKVTFTSNFDARTFMSRFEANKDKDGVPSIFIRPYRTKEDQVKYKRYKKDVKDLNDAAKEAGDECSYSLRNNGAIWKFVQVDGRWRRDENWNPEDKNQGNH
eukprot:GHVO01022286.1.p3 GENE.GHVO01022286.1~~GHVO01022286.1.p3  ORF type:complete len:121 (-),score=15.81 GHVO01022286.1:827-1189(-)